MLEPEAVDGDLVGIVKFHRQRVVDVAQKLDPAQRRVAGEALNRLESGN
jgi:hypothetical protein